MINYQEIINFFVNSRFVINKKTFFIKLQAIKVLKSEITVILADFKL